MTIRIILMTTNQTLATQLHALAKQHHWILQHLTTSTSVVVALEERESQGIWWDLDTTNLETTLATMTLIRKKVSGAIAIFSARFTDDDQEKLYQSQIDDLIVYPFKAQITGLQIKQRFWSYSQVQRQPVQPKRKEIPFSSIRLGDWQINQHDYTITKNDELIVLTPKEFKLLSYLMDHHGHVLSREQLVNGVWGYDILNTSRIVDIHVSHLRDKLEDDPKNPQHLLTIRGFGYKLI